MKPPQTTPRGSRRLAWLALVTSCSLLAAGLGAWAPPSEATEVPAPPSPPSTSYLDLDGGYYHSVALRPDGSVLSWGSDDYDQVSETPTGNDFVAVAAGNIHSLALRADGSIVSWGSDNSGQVSETPTGNGFVAIAAGGFHGVALRTDGSIVSWGVDTYGLVDDTPAGNDFVAVAAGQYLSLALRADGSIVAWGWDRFDLVSDAPAGNDFAAVATGGYHALALRVDGSVVGWGGDAFGQVSEIPPGNDFVALAAGADHSTVLRADGSIVSWGSDIFGQVSESPTTSDFVAIVAGSLHGLALRADGWIVGWGLNGDGQADWQPPTEPPNPETTVTVAVHGAMFFTSEIDTVITDAVYDYWNAEPGDANLLTYRPSSGTLRMDRGHHTSPSHQVIQFDWSAPAGLLVDGSTACASGMDEAAGDALFAMLIQHDLLEADYLHLIGFSRGSVVASEAAQRLVAYGFEVDQLTLIDQEPGEVLHNDAGPPKAWEGIGYVDNYYGEETLIPTRLLRFLPSLIPGLIPNPLPGVAGPAPLCIDGDLSLQGEPVEGAYDHELDLDSPSVEFGNTTIPLGDHFLMESWYASTVGDDSATVGYALRTDPAARAAAVETGARTSATAPPTVINGDFSYHHRNVVGDAWLAGWSGHGGGGEGDWSRIDNDTLRLSRRDESRRHNRLYIPEDAISLRFEMKRTNRDGGLRSNDRFDVYIDGTRLQRYSMRDRDRSYRARTLSIPPEFRGGVHTIRFRLTDIAGRRVNSAVRIDNVSLARQVGG